MLTKIIITLENKEKYGFEISSLLHGVLMELIPESFAEKLHENGVRPYAQYIKKTEDSLIWTISTYSAEAEKYIAGFLMSDEFYSVYLKHKQAELPVIKKEMIQTSYTELMNSTYFGNCSRTVRIDFVTPTSFKVNGDYQFYPTVEHIFKSLINKHDAMEENTEIYSDGLIEEIMEKVSIKGYRLKSVRFHLEGVSIPAFMGSITIRIRGMQTFVNLLNMMLKLGEYTGVGIKAGIGMGAIVVEQKERKGKTSEQ